MIATALAAAVAVSGAITAHAPNSVPIDDRLPVHGRVEAGERPRPVRLQEQTVGGWVTIATDRTRRTGRFRLDVSSGHVPTDRVLRVVAPRSRHLAPARSRSLTVRIVVPGLRGARVGPSPA